MFSEVTRDMNVGDLSGWGLKAWDFDEFHRAELPARLESGVNDKVTWDLECAPPFSITLPDGRAYSYALIAGKVQITPGIHADAQCVIELQERAWQNYVHELRTPSSLVLSQAVHFLRGNMDDWRTWAPAIQCMYSGREIFDPSRPLLSMDGTPLDLKKTFLPEDDTEEMSHFLRTAGYLVIRGAMAHRREEIATEIERIRSQSREGEIFSWWTQNLDTEQRFPYRLMFLSERSPLIRSLMEEDTTVRDIVRLSKRSLVPLHDRGQGAMTVLKPFGEGAKLAPSIAGNLGWHADCGLGGCSIMCPSINIGIHLDAAGSQSSRLWALAGTHGRSVHNTALMGTDHPRAVPLDTSPGDVTIHYSCLMHAGPPPTGPHQRRTLYLPFYAPETLQLLGRFQSFEQILPGFGTGNIPSLDQVAEEQKTYRDNLEQRVAN